MRSGGWGRWLRLVFLGAVVVFGGLFVERRWHDVQQALSRLAAPPVAGSFILATLGSYTTMLSWRRLLADYGSPLPLRVVSRVFFVGQLGKYIPGSVWSVVAQAELGRDYQVPRPASVTVSIVSVAQTVFAGVVFGVFLLPLGLPSLAREYWWVALIIPVYAVVLQPVVIAEVTHFVFRLTHLEPPHRDPSYRGLVGALGWTVVSWLLFGLHAWLLTIGLGGPAPRLLPVCVGAFALAFSVGLVSVPVPAGVGVREAVFTVLVGSVIGVGEAIAVALLSRVMLALVDFGLAGGQAVWNSRLERRVENAVRRHDHS
ncbi:MAG TPA: lysylphosphatidylglycerol synthase transmembrane domain-containing protein [Mycobacteriales bacterium]|nr:lysylphosphatidylglycerol synthase transmembrane domain-containing protein [Mycobacteriales bacterium]